MVTEKIKELEELQARAAELQASIETERNAELASLPGKYGYDSVDAFIKALRSVGGSSRKVSSSRAPASTNKKRRTRAKITPEIKEQVKSLVESGKTGAEIASSLGISMPSVQNIKKELGLVKARS